MCTSRISSIIVIVIALTLNCESESSYSAQFQTQKGSPATKKRFPKGADARDARNGWDPLSSPKQISCLNCLGFPGEGG